MKQQKINLNFRSIGDKMIQYSEVTQPEFATSITKKFDEHCDNLAMAICGGRQTGVLYPIIYDIRCQEAKKYRGEYVPGGIIIFDSSEDLLEFKLK